MDWDPKTIGLTGRRYIVRHAGSLGFVLRRTLGVNIKQLNIPSQTVVR